MDIDFIKLYVFKNDFLLINYCYKDRPSDIALSALSRQVCRRKTGIGCNGLLLLLPGKKERIRLKLYTPYGYPTELCNDSLFCLGRYAFDSGLFSEGILRVETDRGTRTVEAIDSNNFRISLGSPYDINKTNRIIEVADREYTRAVTINNKQYMITPLTVHQRGAVFFTSDDSLESLRQFSKNIIRSNDQTLHSLQPIFVQILSREDIIVHTWYRGYPKDYISTAAIGATAAIVNGFCDREVIIHNKHEHCYYQWEQTTNEILFTASPKYVFSCSYYYEEREI